MKHLIFLLLAVILTAVAAFVQAENVESLTPSHADLLKLLKERAEPFDNIKIELDMSGKKEIPPIFHKRGPLQGTVSPAKEIKYESSETLMIRGVQATFERETIQHVPSESGLFSHKGKWKWSNAAGHIREWHTPDGIDGKKYMSLHPSTGDHGGGVRHANSVLLALGVGIGRFIESIESIQREPNGDLTVRGTVLLNQSIGSCTMRLNKDYFPLEISIVLPFRPETYEIQIDEVSKIDGHWYAKSGKLVYKYQTRIFDDYAFKISEVKLAVSDEEYEQFTSMPITLDVHVQNNLPKPKGSHLPDLPAAGF